VEKREISYPPLFQRRKKDVGTDRNGMTSLEYSSNRRWFIIGATPGFTMPGRRPKPHASCRTRRKVRLRPGRKRGKGLKEALGELKKN